MKKYGGFIPGCVPARRRRSTSTGSSLASRCPARCSWRLISVLPDFLIRAFNVPFYFGGTSLLIVVGVALDTRAADGVAPPDAALRGLPAAPHEGPRLRCGSCCWDRPGRARDAGTRGSRRAGACRRSRPATCSARRSPAARGSGLEARRYMDAGELVPDCGDHQARPRAARPADGRKGFVLDGFPRTARAGGGARPAARGRGHSLDRVVLFQVADEEPVARLSGRRVCRSCGRNYHLTLSPPRAPGVVRPLRGRALPADGRRGGDGPAPARRLRPRHPAARRVLPAARVRWRRSPARERWTRSRATSSRRPRDRGDRAEVARPDRPHASGRPHPGGRLPGAGTSAKPGVSTLEIDREVESLIRDRKAKPAFKGYRGFPATICASINEEVVHGIPAARRRLREGDIIGLDLGAIVEGTTPTPR